MASDPYARTSWGGKTVDNRTATALDWANRRFRKRHPGKRLELAQGSYSTGVAASAGTHDGGGVVDVRTVPLTKAERKTALRSLRSAGFAAWVRDSRDGMDPHIHACLLGNGPGRYHRTMAALARSQCDDYLAGRNGLRTHARDRNPWRPDPQTRWSHKREKPVPYQ